MEPNVHFPTALPLVHRNFTFYLQLSSRRGGVLGVRTKLRAEYPTNVVRFSERVRVLLLLKSAQTGPLPHTQAFCILGNGTLSPGKKAVALSRPISPPSNKATYSSTSVTPYSFMACKGTTLPLPSLRSKTFRCQANPHSALFCQSGKPNFIPTQNKINK